MVRFRSDICKLLDVVQHILQIVQIDKSCATMISRYFCYDDDDDEIACFSVRRKTRRLVQSATPKPRTNTDEQSRNRNRGSHYLVIPVRDLWWK